MAALPRCNPRFANNTAPTVTPRKADGDAALTPSLGGQGLLDKERCPCVTKTGGTHGETCTLVIFSEACMRQVAHAAATIGKSCEDVTEEGLQECRQACAEICDLVRDDRHVHETGDLPPEAAARHRTAREIQLRLYTREGPALYRAVNEALRTGTGLTPEVLTLQRHWELCLACDCEEVVPAPSGVQLTVLYRGVSVNVLQGDGKNQYTPGAVVTWPFFASTSTMLDVAQQFARGGTLFRCRLRRRGRAADGPSQAGAPQLRAKAHDLRSVSVFGEEEGEVLLPAGTPVLVNQVYYKQFVPAELFALADEREAESPVGWAAAYDAAYRWYYCGPEEEPSAGEWARGYELLYAAAYDRFYGIAEECDAEEAPAGVPGNASRHGEASGDAPVDAREEERVEEALEQEEPAVVVDVISAEYDTVFDCIQRLDNEGLKAVCEAFGPTEPPPAFGSTPRTADDTRGGGNVVRALFDFAAALAHKFVPNVAQKAVEIARTLQEWHLSNLSGFAHMKNSEGTTVAQCADEAGINLRELLGEQVFMIDALKARLDDADGRLARVEQWAAQKGSCAERTAQEIQQLMERLAATERMLAAAGV